MYGLGGYKVLIMALVAWPLVGALIVPLLARWRETAAAWWTVGVVELTLMGVMALIPGIGSFSVVSADAPLFIGNISFSVDPFSLLFARVTAFVWLAATLYSVGYLKGQPHNTRFHVTSLVLLSMMLGIVFAGNLFTLYIFFELLGVIAFLFVIHTETAAAKRAAIKYLWITLAGGLALLTGILLTYRLGGHGLLEPLPSGALSSPAGWITFALLLLGFGVKAGMLPVHVWLPDAHPVAPTPASALLSGIMIKAGAYGIFRVAFSLFRPSLALASREALWQHSGQFGLVILWFGMATMFVGVVMALGQSNAKRMLAYHSISQMGFILAGIGAASYLGPEGALGVAGGLYHVVNHALFKSALFLGVGAVAFRTNELDMYRLGGLWRKMPFTFAFTLIAAAGITGVPLFNGFVSKSLIHHALVEAFEYRHLFSLGIAEKIFVATSAGTTCSFIKLISLVFLGKPKHAYDARVKDPPVPMLLGMALLSGGIVVLGVWPQVLIDGVFTPGLAQWGISSTALQHYLAASYLRGGDILSVVIAFGMGAAVFVAGMKFGWFHLRAPRWVGVNFYYAYMARWIMRAVGSFGVAYAMSLSALSHALAYVGAQLNTAYVLNQHRRQLSFASRLDALGVWAGHIASPDQPCEDSGELEGINRLIVMIQCNIRRYARDMSINVAVIVVVFLVILASLMVNLLR